MPMMLLDRASNERIEAPDMTPEDLLVMPDSKDYELIDGQLVERAMGELSSWVGMEIGVLLSNFVKANRLGWVYGSDCGYQCFAFAPRKVCKPDCSFVSRAKNPTRPIQAGWIKIVPDLVVEVISTHDVFQEIDQKVLDYLAAGVGVVWVVNPFNRTVIVHHSKASAERLSSDQELTGGEVLKGFSCLVDSLFPPPDEVQLLPRKHSDE